MGKLLLLTILLFLFIAPVAEARSGCCSHHGGVQASGCGCNDGTPLSDTCAPYYSCSAAPIQETVQEQYVAPTNTPIPARVFPTYTPVPTRKPLPTRTPIPTRTPTPTITMTPAPTATPTPTIKPKPIKKIMKPTPKPDKKWWDWIFGK